MSHTPCLHERDSRLNANPIFKRTALSVITGIGLLGLVACGGGSSGKKDSGSTTSSKSSSSVSTSSSSSSSSSVDNEGLTMLSAKGNKWVKASGNPVNLKGTNLGNWLVQEFWMMDQGLNGIDDQCKLEAKLTERFGKDEKERLIKLFRDNWMTTRDWDNLQSFGLNIVRLPIMWSLIEDETKPKTLRADAWNYIDLAITEAKKRGMYVIIDLHGAVGGQSDKDHTGCAGQNKYWSNTDYQDRTKWLWEQIATKYKDEPVVAAYDPLNEPWGNGKDQTAADMVTRITEIYETIRKVDPKHIVLLPGFYNDTSAWDKVVTDKGMTNVAYENHPYPGIFDNRDKEDYYTLQRDWLRCGEDGKGGLCSWVSNSTKLNIPYLMGEFQTWQQAPNQELGAQVTRATYDTYAQYNFAATSWSYKFVSSAGGRAKGNWGMVTNAVNTNVNTGIGMVVKASTWDCNNWDSTFANACATKPAKIKVGGTGSKTLYLVIKTGALDGSNPDVTYDNISITNDSTSAEVVVNGGFGSNTGWKEVAFGEKAKVDYNFTGGNVPVGGAGPVMRITRPSGATGLINQGVYQALTLEGGQTYTLNGTFKGNSSSNTWAEVYLVESEPVEGKDITGSTSRIDFTSAPLAEIEALFKSFGTQPLEPHAEMLKAMTSKDKPSVFNLPAAPTGLNLSEGTSSNTLTWVASTSTGVIGYNVYRSTNGGAIYNLVKEKVTELTFVDTQIVKDTTYYYAVAAVTASDVGYRSEGAHTALSYVPVPAKIKAETFTDMSGIQLEVCSDIDGGNDVGHFDPDDYIEFKIDVAADGNYTIDYRLATQPGSAGFTVSVDGTKVDELLDFPGTGGWQSWTDLTSGKSFALTKGKHTLRFTSVGKEWNINWFEIKAAK